MTGLAAGRRVPRAGGCRRVPRGGCRRVPRAGSCRGPAAAAGQRRRLVQLNVLASGALPHQSWKVTVIVPAGLCWQ